jgi:large subunit ribosomal protein L9
MRPAGRGELKMEVILLQKVENLGNIGDKVKVRNGYGRNFLIPTGRATAATAENLAKFEARRAEFEKQAAEQLAAAQQRAAKVAALGGTITLSAKVGEEGRLFGSIGTIDVADALAAQGIEVERSEVRLPDGPIRTTGEHDVVLHLHTDVNADLKVIIVEE